MIQRFLYFLSLNLMSLLIWKSQTVRDVPCRHKRNYFNPYIVVSPVIIVAAALFHRGAFGSLQPAQLAAPLRWSVLCKYKQLLYQHKQSPWVAFNKAMLNEYQSCCADNKLPIVVLAFLLLWKSHSNKIICLRLVIAEHCFPVLLDKTLRQRGCLIGNMKQLVQENKGILHTVSTSVCHRTRRYRRKH